MSFTADEYTAAAKVIAEEYEHLTGSDFIAGDLRKKAAQVRVREDHARWFDNYMLQFASWAPIARGQKAFAYLMDKGWTPPEALQ